MTDPERRLLFDAQTENVRELERAWNHVNRQINALILQKNEKGVEITTKLLTLVYCALAEAIFSKLLHTPDGLNSCEIDQIKSEMKADGVKAGWLKCAAMAVSRVDGAKHNHHPNVLKKLAALIADSIYDPSVVRNKLAHGQWCVALNRENTAINAEITKEIADHDIVELYRRKAFLEGLAGIIEDMIESPNKAHRRDYWVRITDLEQRQQELASWTFEEKVRQLFAKQAHPRQSRDRSR